MITLNAMQKITKIDEEINLFKKHFGTDGCMTIDSAVKKASIFDWIWYADNFLTKDNFAKYLEISDSAIKKYEESVADAVKVYKAKVGDREKAYLDAITFSWKAYRSGASTYKEHMKKAKSLETVYNKEVAPEWKEHRRVLNSILKEYDKKVARTFAELYIAQESK